MKDMTMKKIGTEKVFLVPQSDDTWKTVLSGDLPAPNAAALATEGVYPVEVYYRRTDLNGSGTVEMDLCAVRDELIQTLNWIGKCGHLLLSFWDYQYDMPMDVSLTDILNKAYERGHRLRQQALMEFEAETEHVPLNTLILNAKDKVGFAHGPEPPDRTPDIF